MWPQHVLLLVQLPLALSVWMFQQQTLACPLALSTPMTALAQLATGTAITVAQLELHVTNAMRFNSVEEHLLPANALLATTLQGLPAFLATRTVGSAQGRLTLTVKLVPRLPMRWARLSV